MPTFTSFANDLPDPNFKIGYYGATDTQTEAKPGPGFASVKLTNDQKMLVSRTNSQRILARSVAGQKWNVDINYHPMTREQFEPVYSFLLRQKGPITPFFVSLPQYRVPQNASWNTIVTQTFDATSFGGSSTESAYAPYIKTTASVNAGTSSVMFVVGKHTNYPTAYSFNGSALDPNVPRPGDMVTFATHTKAYLITSVETNHDYQASTTQPTTTQFRINVSPDFTETIAADTVGTFSIPKIKVVMPQPLREYSLNTDNLYSFNLKLEEYL